MDEFPRRNRTIASLSFLHFGTVVYPRTLPSGFSSAQRAISRPEIEGIAGPPPCNFRWSEMTESERRTGQPRTNS